MGNDYYRCTDKLSFNGISYERISFRVNGGKAKVVSVRTAADVPKDAIWQVMEAINALTVSAPVKIGDVLVPDIAGTGIALTATKAVGRE